MTTIQKESILDHKITSILSASVPQRSVLGPFLVSFENILSFIKNNTTDSPETLQIPSLITCQAIPYRHWAAVVSEVFFSMMCICCGAVWWLAPLPQRNGVLGSKRSWFTWSLSALSIPLRVLADCSNFIHKCSFNIYSN